MLSIQIASFSYKTLPLRGAQAPDALVSDHGGGFVFDCRALPNPGREVAYQSLTGRDSAVREYLARSDDVTTFLELVFGLINASAKSYVSRGFDSLTIEFGCTGGQHRSVYCAEAAGVYLASAFDESIATVSVTHIEMTRRGML